MYIKLIGDTAHPYTIQKLREDNPAISFPRKITNDILLRYSVLACRIRSEQFDPLVQTQEDAGYVKEGERWFLTKVATNLPDEIAQYNVRQHRDELLQKTDWQALSDVAMTDAMTTYRQALRDVSNQEGFPFSVEWPIRS